MFDVAHLLFGMPQITCPVPIFCRNF